MIGTSSRKFLGFMFHSKEIDLDPGKTKAIKLLDLPKNKTRIFTRNVSYVPKFIPPLLELLEPFNKLFNKNTSFRWHKEQPQALQRIKDVLSSSLTRISLMRDCLLLFIWFLLTNLRVLYWLKRLTSWTSHVLIKLVASRSWLLKSNDTI